MPTIRRCHWCKKVFTNTNRPWHDENTNEWYHTACTAERDKYVSDLIEAIGPIPPRLLPDSTDLYSRSADDPSLR